MSTGELLYALSDAARQAASESAAAWTAFQQFCHAGPSTPAATVLTARGLERLAGNVTSALRDYPNAHADSAKLAECLELISVPWNARFDQAPEPDSCEA